MYSSSLSSFMMLTARFCSSAQVDGRGRQPSNQTRERIKRHRCTGLVPYDEPKEFSIATQPMALILIPERFTTDNKQLTPIACPGTNPDPDLRIRPILPTANHTQARPDQHTTVSWYPPSGNVRTTVPGISYYSGGEIDGSVPISIETWVPRN